VETRRCLVYKKIRLRMGGHLRIVSSGGAPLPNRSRILLDRGYPDLSGLRFDRNFSNRLQQLPVNRMGSSGKPIANVQVRAAEDGEILVKGPCVMQGYFKNPEATREVLSEDGWFSTGDIGYLDKDNYLFITDRKKDLLKTAAGNSSPAAHRKRAEDQSYILNAMVTGDRRKFISALIVPNATTVAAKAADQGISFHRTPNWPPTPGCTRLSTPRSSVLPSISRSTKPSNALLSSRKIHFDNGSSLHPQTQAPRCRAAVRRRYRIPLRRRRRTPPILQD